MRDLILDIDLDYFVHPRVFVPQVRKSHHHHHQWMPMDNFLRYLAAIGVLNRPSISATILEEHNEVIACWNSAIVQKLIKPPFDILHVDAHSDFYTSPALLTKLNTIPMPDRVDIAVTVAAPSDFLIYAFYLGWIHNFYWLRPEPQKHDVDHNIAVKLLGTKRVKVFTQSSEIRLRPASLITITESKSWCPIL